MQTVLIISSLLLWILVLINFIVTLAIIQKLNKTTRAKSIMPPEMLGLGEKAPAFNLQTLDGKSVSLVDYSLGEIMMVFVTPGCEPCTEKMPLLNDLYSKMKKAEVELVIVSLANLDDTSKYVDTLKFRAPILTTPDNNTVNSDYKISGTPSYYFIDRNRHITAGGFLDSDWHRLISVWN